MRYGVALQPNLFQLGGIGIGMVCTVEGQEYFPRSASIQWKFIADSQNPPQGFGAFEPLDDYASFSI